MTASGGTAVAAGPALAPELASLSIGALAALVGEDGASEGEPSELAMARLARWLTPAERTTYHSFDLPKRRRDWLAGRLAAKDVVRRRHGLEGDEAFQSVEIVALLDGPRRGRPVYRLAGQPGPHCLSIAHSGDTALVALARQPGQEVGVDLDEVAPREPSFEALALSPPEQRLLRGLTGTERWTAVTRIWVLKEAFSKALGTGLRLALPGLCVALDPISGQLDDIPFRALAAAGRTHPLLEDLERRHAEARCFTLGGRIAAWVVLTNVEAS